jgi:hypothetical protein
MSESNRKVDVLGRAGDPFLFHPIPTGVYLIQFSCLSQDYIRIVPFVFSMLLFMTLRSRLKGIDIDLLSTPQTGEEDPLIVSLLLRLGRGERIRGGWR